MSERSASGVFVASTGQHVGKTTTSLGLFSALVKRVTTVAFMKPVGQELVKVDTSERVDKDTVLFRRRFNLQDRYSDMSPVTFPKGFTRDVIDGAVDIGTLEERISRSFLALSAGSDMVLAEGTGHVGVGSIAGLDNARVAQLLGLPVVMIVSGGLGSAFDALALNKHACDRAGVPIAAVVLNRVLDDKREMVVDYMGRALARWNIPLLGAVPYNDVLASLRMDDYASLFKVPLLTGTSHRYRHFDTARLVATTNEIFEQTIEQRQLTITPASRRDIIESALLKHNQAMASGVPLEPGIILTGRYEPDAEVVRMLDDSDLPMIYVPLNAFQVMQKISAHTAKIQIEDTAKVNLAIDLVERHLDVDRLTELIPKR
ncbi:MAG: cobyrinic acid a,c-diamide synthase [Spirochaetaceae bacterium]|nr:MAG: cobyrinic acid a,c-diamide synthase [Spirochaetaceae bacterium]